VLVGNIAVDPVFDGTAYIPVGDPFLVMPAEAWARHPALLTADGAYVELTMGGFLIRTDGRVALVDAGMGPIERGFLRGGALLDSLASLGVAPADVTDVLFTHLHFDHVGWATQQGTVTFPNAVHRCHAADWAHFVGPDPRATKKLAPLTDRLELWHSSGPVLAGVDALEAVGHTPGSTIIVISSGVERALLLGDVAHCPVELLEEEWAGIGDVDPELARRARNAVAREVEGTDTPVAAAHFPGLRFGRLLSGQGTRRWVVP
jgi:glyoxylase-like metal-dependent hydrolase (beta-lactamase superfamily II)